MPGWPARGACGRGTGVTAAPGGEAVGSGLDEVRGALGRQEMRFTAWIEGVEANLDEHQRDTSESLTEFAAILRSHLGRSGQEFEVLRETSKDHEERLRRLEGAA